jgi:hypothetical protein
MVAPIADATSRFSDRILRFLEKVEHRVASTPTEKEAVYRLRYQAYLRNGLIEPHADERLHDEQYDDAPNAWITTTFIDGELASTTRVNVAAREGAPLPSFAVYPDVMRPYLREGRVIVESTRTAARLDLAGRFPELPYITLRPTYLAADFFDADFAIATARADHVAFFRRVFGFAPWCEPREYPDFAAKVLCLGMDFHALRDGIEARYPFFRSTVTERDALFGLRGVEVRRHANAYRHALGIKASA